MSEKYATSETACRATFLGNEDNEKLADLIEQEHPNLACEVHSVGIGSPGAVADSEILWRVLVSPRDIDPVSGMIHEPAFGKVYKNGLSVVRSDATTDELRDAAVEGMIQKEGAPPPQIQAILACSVAGGGGIRDQVDQEGARLFGVYDQTIPKREPPHHHLTAHAGVFLRLPLPKTENRRVVQKDRAGLLRSLFEANRIDVHAVREGLFVRLNQEFGLSAADDVSETADEAESVAQD